MPVAVPIVAGRVFHRLTVICEEPRVRRGKKPLRMVRCMCQCGKETVTKWEFVLSGQTKSCGCLMRENQKAARPPLMIKHGHARHVVPRSPEYNIWLAIKDRCLNPQQKFYEYYGGRGITICDEWRDDFMVFLRDVGPRPDSKLQIDRIDNNGNYEPGNVRWATKAEQMANRRPYKKRNAA